jgi:dolichol-phosphate mannosyltransferase
VIVRAQACHPSHLPIHFAAVTEPLGASSSAVDVSVIVPVLREAENLPELARRVHAALSSRRYELLIVDDNSQDGTDRVCAELAKSFPLRLVVRAVPKDGLSGAVLHGIANAAGRHLVVMDGDLQHPPERLPDLLAVIEQGRAEFALGSRYVSGGGIAQNWSAFRRLNSNVATLLAKPFAGTVRDPMSGFFALSRATFDRGRFIAPLGYKIALELICKCRVDRVEEVPIHFALRERGQSKLSLRQQLKYLEHLSRLYDFTYPRLVPATKFVITVGFALLAAWVAFYALSFTSINAAARSVIGYLAGVGIVSVFHARYVRTQHEFLARPTPWRDFLLSAVLELLAVTAVALFLMTRVPDLSEAELLLIPFACGTVARYVLRKEFLLDIRGLRFQSTATDRAV